MSRPELAPASALLKEAFLPVAQPDQPYVDLGALNERLRGLFEFSIQRLDFRTGHVLDDSGRPAPADLYFRPLPPHKIQAWLQESKPFKDRRGGDFFVQAIDIHLRDNEDGSNRGAMSAHTTWAYVGMPRAKLLYRADGEHSDWKINYVYRQSLDPTAHALKQKANPEKPHVVISVSEGARLRDGVICTSELSTLLFFAADSSVTTAKKPHAICPIMVITASCDTVRITQAIWNVKTGQIRIRMSPILEFPGGLWKNSTQYLSLLGWVVSDAVGKTR
ncbi:hypothetical protein QQX98_008417 [Neonectria punicea]|uniref:Uncharacterized protein n=1 Tax=Neonectria punicea TaxID=979145 RepID=A0ABR1GV88_9HYPO